MRIARVLLSLAAVLCWTDSAGSAIAIAGGPAQKQVLAIYSMRREAQFAVLADRELPRILRDRLGTVDFYSEYLDLARFPDPDYQAAMRDYLRVKYAGRAFDAIIALQDVAAQFVEKNRAELFPDVPVVFLAANPPRLPNTSGIRLNLDFTRSLALAMTLDPTIEQVFVVTGSSQRDAYYENIARTQFRPFEQRVRLHYLSDMPTAEIEERVAALPERSIVYYVLFYQDSRGVNLEPADYFERLSTIANRPMYSWTDGVMGRGVVGGGLRSADAQIQAAANQTARILQGERADAIGVTTPDLYVDQVDWRQLQRWGISERRVPSGTIVRFREAAAWERYKGYIVGAVLLLLIQSALITGLLIQRARRRVAEEQVRRTQAELRASYDRIQDLGARLIVAQEAERSRIARELHDDVSQQMAVVAVDLELLRRARGRSLDEVDALARSALDRVKAVIKELHDISHQLHPPKLRLIGLVPALTGLARELSTPERTVTFTSKGLAGGIPQDLTLCFYRVSQEALQNALKHSGARTISMELTAANGTLTLSIADDGSGFDVHTMMGRGLGLISMSERLDTFRGKLSIESRPGAGTRVMATAPFVPDAMEQAVNVGA
jgi:signal transduction histidine kinase